MKKLLLISLLVFTTSLFAQNTFELNYQYTVGFKHCEEQESGIYKEDSICLVPSADKRVDLLKFIVANNEKVKNKRVKVYSIYGDHFNILMTSTEQYQTQVKEDTFYVPDAEDLDYVATREVINYEKTAYLKLVQEWYYNATTKNINVVVNGIAPVFEFFDQEGYYKGTCPMYWLKQQALATPANAQKIINDSSIIWAHRMEFQIPVFPKMHYQLSNKRDVPSIKKLFNQELADILFLQAVNKEIDVYSPQTGEKLSARELKKALFFVDSLYDYDSHGNPKLMLVEQPIGVGCLNSMIINQTFIFDPSTMLVTSRINSIILTAENWRGGTKELFEVRF